MLREATNDSHKSSPANKLLGFLTLWDSGPILERSKVPYERSWLEHLGCLDFAGSTVVHSVGGWLAAIQTRSTPRMPSDPVAKTRRGPFGVMRSSTSSLSVMGLSGPFARLEHDRGKMASGA